MATVQDTKPTTATRRATGTTTAGERPSRSRSTRQTTARRQTPARRTTGTRTTSTRSTGTRTTRARTTTGRRTTSARGTTTARRRSTARRTETGPALPIPVVTPHVKVYSLRLPGPGTRRVAEAGRSAVSHLPSRKRLLFYGALGAMAALEVISWPVAAAVGVGTAIAGRDRDGREERARAS